MDLYDQYLNPDEKIMGPILIPNADIKTLPITPNAFEKMHLYREMYDSLIGGSGLEFFGFMFRKYDPNSYGYKDINNHVIREIILGKNQENTYAHTFLDAVDVQSTLASVDKNLWQLAGWTHRHPDGIFSSSSEDKGHNVTTITSIQSSNYLKDYMTIPMSHLDSEFSINDNGCEITFYDKRDGSIYSMQTALSVDDAKNNVLQFKDKKVPVKLAYAHSMIIRRERSPSRVYSEVITRKYTGNSLNYIEKNGQWDGQKTKIEIIPVIDDIVLDEKKMMQEIIECTYIPKIHDSAIHVDKGYAFGEKILSMVNKTGGGYFFINKEQSMSRKEFVIMFSPYLKRRLEPEDYSSWERRAIHEIPILPRILSKDINIANKVLDNATTSDNKNTTTPSNANLESQLQTKPVTEDVNNIDSVNNKDNKEIESSNKNNVKNEDTTNKTQPEKSYDNSLFRFFKKLKYFRRN